MRNAKQSPESSTRPETKRPASPEPMASGGRTLSAMVAELVAARHARQVACRAASDEGGSRKTARAFEDSLNAAVTREAQAEQQLANRIVELAGRHFPTPDCAIDWPPVLLESEGQVVGVTLVPDAGSYRVLIIGPTTVVPA